MYDSALMEAAALGHAGGGANSSSRSKKDSLESRQTNGKNNGGSALDELGDFF